MIDLPDHFIRTVTTAYADGASWLQQLPDLIEERARIWSLKVEPPFSNLSYNYVAPATRSDGTEVVLKLGPPNDELSSEMEALRLYDGCGAARLLECDPDAGALLECRIRPGVMLAALEDDEEATSVAGDIMRRLWRPLASGHKFPTLARWFASLTEFRGKWGGGTGPLPVRLVEEAEALFSELYSSQTEPVLLHGDLHHYNVLRAAGTSWLAIDPKGIYGECAFDIGQFLLNPFGLLERPEPARIFARRINQFADELNLDRERIRGWALAKTVLSACWAVEDGADMTNHDDLACAEILSAIAL